MAAAKCLLALLVLGLATSTLGLKCLKTDFGTWVGTPVRGTNKNTGQVDVGTGQCYTVYISYSLTANSTYSAVLKPTSVKGTYASGYLTSAACDSAEGKAAIKSELDYYTSSLQFVGWTVNLNEWKDWVCCKTTDLCNTGSSIEIADGAVARSASALAILLAALLAMVVARM